jgi:CheY-like chemotaxis protein
MTISASETAIARPRRIHVVNDTPEILDVFRMLLEDEGYIVTTDRFTPELGPKMEHVRAVNPDLLILDLIVNGEEIGWQLLQLLKMDRETRSIPVIICTAAVKTVSELQSHLDEMGIKVVLKPFDIDHLIEVVKNIFNDSELLARLAREE